MKQLNTRKPRQRKRAFASSLCLILVCSLFSGFKNEISLLSDIYGEDFHATPTGEYVGNILSGNGSYFYEQHNLFSSSGTGYLSQAAYCIEPKEPAPNSNTSFSEISYNSSSTSSVAQKSAASAVLMYGYGGISSINNDLLGYPPCEQSLGGSFGLYVENGTARTGLLINGIFYPMYASEAQAVTACAIHKLNGASINSVSGSIYGHNEQVANTFNDLYNLGNWARGNTAALGWDSTHGFLTGFTTPTQSISISVQNKDGNFVNLPSGYSAGTFNWLPYTKDNNIIFKVSYYATKCESRLLKNTSSGGRISVTHSDMTTFPDFPNNNGYYDYFSVKEGPSNTIPLSISYQGLKSTSFDTLKLGVIDHSYGGFPPTTGTAFTQEAYITIKADDLKSGLKLDLSIEAPKAYTFTPFFGDGDGNGESYAAGRFFHSNGYQDITSASPRGNTNGATVSLKASHSTGGITIQKKSNDTNINNTNYTLSGASYGLFTSKTDAGNLKNMVSQSTTNSYGTASFSKLEFGTYYVRETKAPNGYKLDPTIYTIAVNSEAFTTQTIYEEPIAVYPSLLLSKISDNGIPLEDARFTVCFYEESFSSNIPTNAQPKKTWIFVSDSEGKVIFDSSHLLSGDTLYLDKNNKVFLPLGTLTIEETTPPEGYIKADGVTILPITFATADTFQLLSNDRIIENKEIKRAFQLKKYGHDAYDSTKPLPQAGFMAWKLSTLDIDENGEYILSEDNAVILGNNGEKEIFTDADGYLCSIPLSYGEYLVKETTTPSNYYPVDSFIINVQEASDEPLELIELVDEEFFGYIRCYKLDSTNGELIRHNPASFTIKDEKNNEYIYFDTEDGEKTNIIKTDETGMFTTPEPLPPGAYIIEEVSPPTNYSLEEHSFIVTIGIDEIYDIALDTETATKSDAEFITEHPYGIFSIYCQNEPLFACIEINKTGEHREWSEELNNFLISEIPLSDIEFDLFAAEDIYLPDGHNKLLYKKGQKVETIITGNNGYGISSKCLPIGHYQLIELTPDIYQPTEPMDISITLDDTIVEQNISGQIQKRLIKHLDIKNYLLIPDIITYAIDLDTNTQTGKVREDNQIVDNITYSNLIPGRTYTIKGTMVSKEDGSPIISNKEEVSAITTFVCKEPEGTETVNFELDSTSLQGSSVVLYESLYEGDTLVCIHEDLGNEKQTISYPRTNTPKGPKTGDSFPLSSIIILMIASFLTLLFFIISFISTKKR